MTKRILFTLLMMISIVYGQTWTKRSGVSMATGTNGFYEYKPAGYNGVTKFPVIIAFHGLGECGNGVSQLDLVLNLGVGYQIQNYGFPYAAVVIVPQISSPWPGAYVFEGIINYVRANYAIDTTRLYLTGLSMGGTVLDWSQDGNLYKAAAIAAVCPATVWQSFGNRFKAYDMPIRFFHGSNDLTQSWNNSIGWQAGLNAPTAISPRARMDSMMGQGHGIWGTVYDYYYIIPGTSTNVYQWMLAQQRTNYTGIPGGSGGGGPPPPTDTFRVDVGASALYTRGYKTWRKLDEAYISG